MERTPRPQTEIPFTALVRSRLRLPPSDGTGDINVEGADARRRRVVLLLLFQ